MDAQRRAMGGDEGGHGENAACYEVYLAGGATLEEVQTMRIRLLQHALPFLHGYIWQHDRFGLQISAVRQSPWGQQQAGRRGQPAADGPAFWGLLRFGDNIEDEWFAVWLLLELTRAFPVTARVWDNDGEFLLIEAAYGLPRWLKPGTAQNRVWLHGGAVHIVPPPRHPGDERLGTTPSVEQALAAVASPDIDTAAPPKVLAALHTRLRGYPEQTAEQLHHARAVVPLRVARLLRAEPQLVAPAVEAFYYRDLDDVRAAARMAALPPEQLVPVRVAFSRCLYAQLALQDFPAPRGYPLPLPSDPQFKATELGMKLTAGFEMVLAKGDDAASVPGEAEGEGQPGWKAYRARLQSEGYFQGEPPASAQYKLLLERAERAYAGAKAYLDTNRAVAAPAAAMERVLKGTVEGESFSASLEELGPDDDESWLTREDDPRLEEELQRREGELEGQEQRRKEKQGGGGAPGGGAGEEYDPRELTSKLRRFMESMAEQEEPAGRPGGGGGGGGVSLDEAAFAAELQRVLGMGGPLPGGWGEGDDSSDEGSSFFTDEGSDEEGGPEEAEAAGTLRPGAFASAAAAAAADQEEAWEARTATDSDDDAEFLEAYGQALDSQLGQTKMAQSFDRAAPAPAAAAGAGPSATDGAEAGEAGARGAGLQPVDLDVNLVKSLLASYGSQQGLPGPASNLAGLLGISLPEPSEVP